MKQPMRLKSGGFISSGTDAGDLKILRTAKNIDDGSANGMKAGGRLATRKKQKEVAGLKRKAKAKEKLSKSGPPSKKELVNKAANLMSKRETMRTEGRNKQFGERVRKRLREYDLSSKATRDIANMLDKRIKNVDMSDLRSNVSQPLRKRQKLIRELKKEGAAKQVPAMMKEGGKTKSRVNEAGNYTKPGLRKRIFNRIKAGGKGGRPGQWSARKAQMMAKAYKKAGGGYK